jgi:photosystem II stability/assembly factor-like uncharacterized protein
MWYDGSQHPWEFKRVWHIEPSLTDADTVYAGVEDAGIFRSTDGGKNWKELAGLRGHGTGPRWQPGAGGMCLHTIILDKSDPKRIYIAISAAGAFRTDDGGKTWKPINKGLYSQYIPEPTAEVGHCVHHVAMNPARPNVLFMQKHWDVMRSDNAGDSWKEVSGNLPTDFGFVIDVHAHDPETIYVVPIKSDGEHFPLEGKLRVYRSKSGGNEWEALTKGLPQKDCYVNVLRDAMAVDSLDKCGVYFGTTGGQVYGSSDAGDSWAPIVEHLPAVLSVEVASFYQDTFERWRTPAQRFSSTSRVRLRSVPCSTPSKHSIRCCEARSAITSLRSAVPFCASSPAPRTIPLSRRIPRPDAIASGAEPLLIIGAIAGG